jgi:hypothetical protein
MQKRVTKVTKVTRIDRIVDIWTYVDVILDINVLF